MVYPPDPASFGYVHIGTQYSYEYLRGARIVDETKLNNCENIVSTFFQDWQTASKVFQSGLNSDYFPTQIEGVF